MDKSKEYILMCEQAEEIQKVYRPSLGDFYKCKIHDKVECLYMQPLQGDCKSAKWLPRQDQLQEMIDNTESNKLTGIEKWTDKTYQDHWKPWGIFKSFEQLWLAFVMKENYSKVWDGKEWINETDKRT